MDLSILWYLVPSVIMTACGVYGFITRKNMINIYRSVGDSDIHKVNKMKF